jgi:NADPH-dependent glutamate synthase beta subunit-like oxidoreductase
MAETSGAEPPQFAVAIVGGATAGAEVAGILSRRGVLCVVFEQNPRPYGKIEDGLPRWHVKLRQKEYENIVDRLDHPLVHFVPYTKIGRDLSLTELANEWGFTAVVLAHGAWSDRPLPVPEVDQYINKGLIYQNSFIYWFNHFPEREYAGPRYEVADGAIVVGGGLASIDVMKALQIELVRKALAERGIEVDALDLEHAGVSAALAVHGLTWEGLGLRGATLFYRRRLEDMPLTDIADDVDEGRRARLEATRLKILDKAKQKFCFRVRPQMRPVAALVENGRLVGLRFQRTRVEGGKAVGVEGGEEDVRAPLVISSIGSIPEEMAGVPLDGQLYRFSDRELGRLEGFPTVFSTGNVVTGKGNIRESRRHSISVAMHIVEQYLGLGEGNRDDEAALLEASNAALRARGERLAEWVVARRPLQVAELDRLLAKVRERQVAVGYRTSFAEWIAKVTPPDLA